MRRKRTTECVMSDEMTLHEFYGAMDDSLDILIKIVRKSVLEYLINRL